LGFYPIALEDLLHAADDLKAIADPNIILFICAEGREVGYTLALPNVNEVFHAARGRKGVLRFLEMALRLQFQKIKAQRLAVLGVEPAYRDKGLSALLFSEAFRAARERFEISEVSGSKRTTSKSWKGRSSWADTARAPTGSSRSPLCPPPERVPCHGTPAHRFHGLRGAESPAPPGA